MPSMRYLEGTLSLSNHLFPRNFMGNFRSPKSQKLEIIAENPSAEEVKGNGLAPFQLL